MTTPLILDQANASETWYGPTLALRVIQKGELTFVYNGILAFKWGSHYLYEDAPGFLVLVADDVGKTYIWEVEKSQFASAVMEVFKYAKTAFLRRS